MSTQWIKAALIRAAKTVAQTMVATIGAAAVLSDVEWKVVVSAAILAGILSILTSIAGIPEAEPMYMWDETEEELSDGWDYEADENEDDEEGDGDES